MSRTPSDRQPRVSTRRLLGVAVGALVLLVWASTTPTLSAWTAGVVANSASSVAPATLVFTHSAGPCTLGPRLSASTQCPGTLAGTETVTNGGTAFAAQLAQRVTAASCATVKLDNRATAANVLLPRFGTRFQQVDRWSGTNAVTLDGTGYAASVTQQTTASTNGSTYGYGVWFKAASGQSGPLLGFGVSPTTATNTGDDRTLHLNANGTLSFYAIGGGGMPGTITSAAGTSYADGQWHFAYVTMADTTLNLNTSLYVDSTTSVASASVLGTAYATSTGYWHLGWGSTALTGQAKAFFTGSLSNLVVFNGNAPAPPTVAQRASQAAFTTWASTSGTAASEHWLLGDTGTTTYALTQPVIGTTSPCTMANITWTFTNPAATALSNVQLSAFANNTPVAVGAAPGPGVAQSSSLVLSQRAATYNAYVAGLRLYVPITYLVQTTAGKWPLSFLYTSGDSSLVAP